MSTSINLLLLFSENENFTPPPAVLEQWIDNLNNTFVTNLGDRIVFNVG